MGYNLKDRIVNNTIKIQDEVYEVVGILGDRRSNALKDSIYINFNSMDFTLSMKAITMDTLDYKASDVAMDISKRFNDSKRAEVYISEPYGKHDPLKEAVGDNRLHLILAFFISICLISTVINISFYWIDKEKAIIGIKSLVGGTKKGISSEFWAEYQFTIALSIISSYIAWMVYNLSSGANNTFLLKGLSLLTLINIAVSTLSIIPSIINLNRLDINSIIKENN